ncbi:MAG: hypothetical protein IJ669_08645 [Prevotella sp.]|nr:hypothetical protein [Prevotella sp.]
MKKLLLMFAVMMLSLSAFSQSSPNRMIVIDKARGYKGFVINRLDSVIFRSVEGRVAADVQFISYEKTDDNASKIKCSVTRTDNCHGFKVICMSKTNADAYTSEIALANYIDRSVSQIYTQDFTNAEMTGFDFEFQANTSYSILTLAFDEYGIPCDVSRADFTTPSASIVGNPTVAWTLDNASPTSLTLTMTPNADCAGYYICLFKEGEAEQQFAQWGPFFGFANMGDMIKRFSGKKYTDLHTNEWTGLVPSTNYEIYIQPVDINDEYGSMVIANVTTATQGGDGIAEVTITIGDFGGDATNGYWQYVIYTPNDQTAFFRDMTIDKAVYDEEWNEEKILEYLQKDDDMNPYWNRYSEDVAQWNAEPNKSYIAFAIAQNAKGEWGPLARKEYTTPSAAQAPGKLPAVGLRMNNVKENAAGVSPLKNLKKGLQLIEK